MALKFLEEADLNDKRVLARFDFNVPMNGNQEIIDTTRIDLALPTIKKILEQNPKKLILMSHRGRPKGKVDLKYSLEPIARKLAELLDEEVTLTEGLVDAGVETLMSVKSSRIILLENVRFHPGEESNDRAFASQIAQYGDVFVHDAFGAAHREHATAHRIMEFFPRKSYAGDLMKREVEALSTLVDAPQKPFMAIVGGAKVSDKIKVIESLLPKVQTLYIGGAMAYPFLKAKGYEVGKSLCADGDVALAKKLLNDPLATKITLPLDHVVANSPDGKASLTEKQNVPENQMALDIGPKTLELYSSELRRAKTVLWNGPMGLFEKEDFSKGTMEVARVLSTLKAAFTVVGGGDSVSAVKKAGVADKLSHVSTGGGASLEFLEKGTLPGVQALKFGL